MRSYTLPLDHRFRANPNYKVVLLDHLEATARAQLEKAEQSDDLYGALVPLNNKALKWRSLSSDTALLVLTLTAAGPIPRYALRQLGDDAERTILRLLIDEVLEIQHEAKFVCGPSVANIFESQFSYTESRPNCDLAVSALQYGQELTNLPEAELGWRLYSYGRQPVSPELRQWLVNDAAVASYLGIDENGRVTRALGGRWFRIPISSNVHDYWWQWISTSELTQRERQRPAGYKLYVSPDVRDAPTMLEIIAGALRNARGITGFKIGVGIAGVCRPDKIVVYFTYLDDLQKFADVLLTKTVGCSAHGVPFSAAISNDGLLSWGADPPAGFVGRLPPISWRMWVTERLAEYLVLARITALNNLEPWQFALSRLDISGIDTDTWVPASGMWREALETG